MTATFPSSGGQVIFRSLDSPDNVRGFSANGPAIDEVGYVKPAGWCEVLRPMLIDTGGWFWGRAGWGAVPIQHLIIRSEYIETIMSNTLIVLDSLPKKYYEKNHANQRKTL
jgi:hypothetical protein